MYNALDAQSANARSRSSTTNLWNSGLAGYVATNNDTEHAIGLLDYKEDPQQTTQNLPARHSSSRWNALPNLDDVPPWDPSQSIGAYYTARDVDAQNKEDAGQDEYEAIEDLKNYMSFRSWIDICLEESRFTPQYHSALVNYHQQYQKWTEVLAADKFLEGIDNSTYVRHGSDEHESTACRVRRTLYNAPPCHICADYNKYCRGSPQVSPKTTVPPVYLLKDDRRDTAADYDGGPVRFTSIDYGHDRPPQSGYDGLIQNHTQKPSHRDSLPVSPKTTRRFRPDSTIIITWQSHTLGSVLDPEDSDYVAQWLAYLSRTRKRSKPRGRAVADGGRITRSRRTAASDLVELDQRGVEITQAVATRNRLKKAKAKANRS